MGFLQDSYSWFCILKRPFFVLKSLRFIREEGIDQITEENRWKVPTVLLPTRTEVATLLGKRQLREGKGWGIWCG